MSNASEPAPEDTEPADPFYDPSDDAWSNDAWGTPLATCEHGHALCSRCDTGGTEPGDDVGTTDTAEPVGVRIPDAADLDRAVDLIRQAREINRAVYLDTIDSRCLDIVEALTLARLALDRVVAE